MFSVKLLSIKALRQCPVEMNWINVVPMARMQKCTMGKNMFVYGVPYYTTVSVI